MSSTNSSLKPDLKELLSRENERVEWKENVADIQSVVKTIVAFANDYSNLGGGYIVCGARETTDAHGFKSVEILGLDSTRYKEVLGTVLTQCIEKVSPEVVPITHEIEVPDDPSRRVLIFVIPSSNYAHSYRMSGKDASTYYLRIGDQTREARDGLLQELLIKKGQLLPWDKRMNVRTSIADIDLLVMRDVLQEINVWSSNKPLEDYLSEKEVVSPFVPSLTGRIDIEGFLCPKNFTILLFGKDHLKYISGAYTIFSVYDGADRSEPTAMRSMLTGTIVEQAKKLIQLLSDQSYTVFDKNSAQPNQVKYPQRALQEALVNAIVHRDYESDQPTRVTVFSDRVEILSPGTLPNAIDKSKFLAGRSSPYWRNQTLAYFFNKLQLAQAEGQGIPTIIRTMKEEGNPAPIFDIGHDSVTCVLPAHPRHKILKLIQEVETKLVIGKYGDAIEKLEYILNEDKYNYRAWELLCEVCNAQQNQIRIFDQYMLLQIDSSLMSPHALLAIGDALSPLVIEPRVSNLVAELLRKAAYGRLEEKELAKVAINLKRIGEAEMVVSFVDEVFNRNPGLARNVVLLEQRAKAKLDLAKKCAETGRNRVLSSDIKAKAWSQCRNYLSDAEKDLNMALEYANYFEKSHIMSSMEFLEKMKKTAQKPEQNKETGVNKFNRSRGGYYRGNRNNSNNSL